MAETSTTPASPSWLPGWLLLPVGRRARFAIAGVVWTAVGMLLVGYTVVWLAPVALMLEVEFAAAGLVVSWIFFQFVFAGIVRKNIARIDAGPERASAWAFQNWRSYLVTIFMVGLGITLRHSSLPKPWLAVVYEGIGVALLLTSLMYHRRWIGGREAA